jgi:hypothetical protein
MIWWLSALSVLNSPACDDGGNDGPSNTVPPTLYDTSTTRSVLSTPVPTITRTDTNTTSPSWSVMIGAIIPRIGPVAMSSLFYTDPVIKLVHNQVMPFKLTIGYRFRKSAN